MACFILHFCNKRKLTAESGCVGDPFALRELADDFAVSVLAHHANQVFPVIFRHPVARLDLIATSYSGFKIGEVLFGGFVR